MSLAKKLRSDLRMLAGYLVVHVFISERAFVMLNITLLETKCPTSSVIKSLSLSALATFGAATINLSERSSVSMIYFGRLEYKSVLTTTDHASFLVLSSRLSKAFFDVMRPERHPYWYLARSSRPYDQEDS
jgi:hypothetical protein